MLVTLSGIVMLVKLRQLRKAKDGIAITPAGIVTDVTSPLLTYKFLLLELPPIKLSNPEILHHAAMSVIYMSWSLPQLEKA